MGRGYTNPDAAGYLMEADACKKVEAELRRIADKYQRKIEREQTAREREFEAAMQYRSENELLDAYGWEVITEKQYELYLDIFHRGRKALENHAPTVNEAADPAAHSLRHRRRTAGMALFSPYPRPADG